MQHFAETLYFIAYHRLQIYHTTVPRYFYGYKAISTFVMYHCGFHNFTYSRLNEVINFSPAGASTKAVEQYIQCYMSGSFKSFCSTHNYCLTKVYIIYMIGVV